MNQKTAARGLEDTTTPCVCCGAELVNCYPGKNQPHLALEFVTQGHYGSTEFDPMDGTMLALNICDACLRAHREKGNIFHVVNRKYCKWRVTCSGKSQAVKKRHRQSVPS